MAGAVAIEVFQISRRQFSSADIFKRYARTSAVHQGSELRKTIVVLGGGGFVGSRVCQQALEAGLQVKSITPSGKPRKNQDPTWTEKVEWIKGDVFQLEKVPDVFEDAVGVVSAVGAFGSSEYIEKLCGDATITAAKAASKAGVPNFVFISAMVAECEQHFRWFGPLKAYCHAKHRAEEAVNEYFPETGVNIRPGFIYGWRQVGNFCIPLHPIAWPLEGLESLGILKKTSQLPILGDLLAAPVRVDLVGRAAVRAAAGSIDKRVLTIDDIRGFTGKGIIG